MKQTLLDLYRVKAGDSCELENGVGFLAFSSDATTNGVGFQARIVAVDTINSTIDSAHFFTGNNGSFRYPPLGFPDYLDYENNERNLMIFQLTNGNPNYLDLTRLETEWYHDYVHIFTVPSFHEGQNITVDERYGSLFS